MLKQSFLLISILFLSLSHAYAQDEVVMEINGDKVKLLTYNLIKNSMVIKLPRVNFFRSTLKITMIRNLIKSPWMNTWNSSRSLN